MISSDWGEAEDRLEGKEGRGGRVGQLSRQGGKERDQGTGNSPRM